MTNDEYSDLEGTNASLCHRITELEAELAGLRVGYEDLRLDAEKWRNWVGINEARRAKQPIIGYVEREEGFYPIRKTLPGAIVTHAFILCKYCNGMISGTSGPKPDAVCLTCFAKDPDER